MKHPDFSPEIQAVNSSDLAIETEESLSLHDPEPQGKSALAEEIERLKRVSFDAAAKRERLPQPLFWSAFGHAISRLREIKKRDRELRENLEGF